MNMDPMMSVSSVHFKYVLDWSWTQNKKFKSPIPTVKEATLTQDEFIDPDDPALTVPMGRYNSMLAILRNTLYMLVKVVVRMFPYWLFSIFL